MAEIFEFAMGATVKDRLTGFKGIIEGRFDWLNGCKQYRVQPSVLDGSKVAAAETFDEERLILAGKTIFKASGEKALGGPMPAPSSPVHKP